MTLLEKIPYAIQFEMGLKNFNSDDISNVRLNGFEGTFHKGNGVYSFELTRKIGAIKKGSIRYLWSVKDGLWD